MMDAAMKREWLKALRSGKYKQCFRQLHDGEGFCCLGVLLDACVEGEWIQEEPGRWMYSADSLVLGDWGVSLGPYQVPNDLYWNAQKLSLMNDKGKSFSEIADWIEFNVEAT